MSPVSRPTLGYKVPLAPAMWEFLVWGQRRRRWADSTCNGYRQRVSGFQAWCKAEGIRAERATTAQIRDYLETAIHPSVETYTGVRTALAAWFAFHVDRGKLKTSPMDQIARYPVRRSLPRAVERDRATEVLDAARRVGGAKWHLFTGLMLFGGLRRAEACKVEWAHLERDPEGGAWLYVDGKGGFERYVPVHPDLQAMFAAWRAESRHPCWVFPGRFGDAPMSVASATQWTRRVLDAAGCTEATGHVLRHTFATRLIEQGVDVPAVSEALGHQTLSSTTIYTRARPARVAEAVQGLDFAR